MKQWLGASAAVVELPAGATVATLLAQLSVGREAAWLRGIAVSVNAEFAEAGRLLQEGDEVGLLPPVSGGASRTCRTTLDDLLHAMEAGSLAVTGLVAEPIAVDRLTAALKRGADGAVVVFDGIVRNHTRGRQTLHLDYEAYEEMAARQLHELAGEALRRFAVRQVTVVHRLGRLTVGESAVLIAVASAHRGPAFEACQWLIDTLKRTVPIWKQESFVDGVVWAAGEPFPEGVEVAHEA
jgi:molybdopterin synthase catalytic subunit